MCARLPSFLLDVGQPFQRGLDESAAAGGVPVERSARHMVEAYFTSLRFDSSHHLGLGDIRLTFGQQEEILRLISARENASGAQDAKLGDAGKERHDFR